MQVYFGKKDQPAVDYCWPSSWSFQVKLLDFTIQTDLKWGGQIDNILKKANSKMFMLRKLKAAGLNS